MAQASANGSVSDPELKVTDTVKTTAIHDLQKILVEEFLVLKTTKGFVYLQTGEVVWLK